SRQKMLKLIDGFDMPFFSMDLSYDITNVNKTLGKFLAEDNLPRLVGNKCYKIVYNFSEPCPWCKIPEIIEKRDDIKQHITLEKDGRKIIFEQTIYPIFDNDGVVVEFGEYLNDITEQYNMLDAIRKSEKELSVISKKNVETISEINTIRKAYNELSDAYEKAKDRIEKMTNVLNRILQQDTVNELLALRSQNKELEVKLHKALTTIKNYSKKHLDSSNKMDEMAKKSIYSIDRLYNIINNKKKIEDEELKKVFEFLGTQILYIKNIIEKKEENDELKSSN
ncbi:MAG: PAS domain-containing protein, partial [Calditerrivibrio sp.]|nr:PAS domain-containing protein [Calditerrivibrio sp.]MCA1932670.1 PAS domain-containing protein [Calditerrivibrio sp.]MCA1980350.1 PAS domain-containing protein [Calditerrivibrio sp.]